MPPALLTDSCTAQTLLPEPFPASEQPAPRQGCRRRGAGAQRPRALYKEPPGDSPAAWPGTDPMPCPGFMLPRELRPEGSTAAEAAFHFPQLVLQFLLLRPAFHMVSLLLPHMTNRLHELEAPRTKKQGISQTSRSPLHTVPAQHSFYSFFLLSTIKDARIIKAMILLLWISLLRVLYA